MDDGDEILLIPDMDEDEGLDADQRSEYTVYLVLTMT